MDILLMSKILSVLMILHIVIELYHYVHNFFINVLIALTEKDPNHRRKSFFGRYPEFTRIASNFSCSAFIQILLYIVYCPISPYSPIFQGA